MMSPLPVVAAGVPEWLCHGKATGPLPTSSGKTTHALRTLEPDEPPSTAGALQPAALLRSAFHGHQHQRAERGHIEHPDARPVLRAVGDDLLHRARHRGRLLRAGLRPGLERLGAAMMRRPDLGELRTEQEDDA